MKYTKKNQLTVNQDFKEQYSRIFTTEAFIVEHIVRTPALTLLQTLFGITQTPNVQISGSLCNAKEMECRVVL